MSSSMSSQRGHLWGALKCPTGGEWVLWGNLGVGGGAWPCPCPYSCPLSLFKCSLSTVLGGCCPWGIIILVPSIPSPQSPLVFFLPPGHMVDLPPASVVSVAYFGLPVNLEGPTLLSCSPSVPSLLLVPNSLPFLLL